VTPSNPLVPTELVNFTAYKNGRTVELCTSNQVDPCPITYSLSNPKPITYQVKIRFQSLPFKCNLQRYSTGAIGSLIGDIKFINFRVADNQRAGIEVGLCTLNQVYP
jgi:hypothetical protein